MPDTLTPEAVHDLLYRAAARATLAPSIHNSQPWRFVVDNDRLDLYADPSRAVPVIDPTGRQRIISCGAALLGARISLAGSGHGFTTTLLPDEPSESSRLASITLAPDTELTADLLAADMHRLDGAARSRRSNRRQFTAEQIPASVVDRLRDAAYLDGAWLHPVTDADDRVMLATLLQHADNIQNANPAYRAEMRAWTTDDPARSDGVPTSAVPHVTGQAHDDIPIRDFDTFGVGELPAETHSSLHETLAIIGTAADHPRDWLAAGQALYRVLLELTDAGYVASLFSQVCEVPVTREQLRQNLRLGGSPQILLRAGAAAPTAPTPRRPLRDVIQVGSVAADPTG